jgi:hypothetical protein
MKVCIQRELQIKFQEEHALLIILRSGGLHDPMFDFKTSEWCGNLSDFTILPPLMVEHVTTGTSE